jgi:hypothetical protein
MLLNVLWSSGIVSTLWALAAYLLVLYAALRWGTGSADRYPGSD